MARVRDRGREAFFGLPGIVGGSGSGTSSFGLLQELELGLGVLLGLGIIFVLAEVARPVIVDIEEIERVRALRRGERR